MKISIYRPLYAVLLLSLLVACQSAPTARVLPTQPPAIEATQAIPSPPASAATPPPASTAAPAATDTQIPETSIDLALNTVRGYFAALQAGDFGTAASYLSDFSLVYAGMTRGDAANELQAQMAQGAAWSDLKVIDSQIFNDKTILVRVSFQLASKDAKTGKVTQSAREELWPVRLELGEWRYNRDNLIDFHTLDVDPQTTAGLTVQPRRLARYSDHLRLTMLVQNSTNEAIVFGQSNEIMAAFVFPDPACQDDSAASQAGCSNYKVEAGQTRLFFDRLRSYPDAAIDVEGLFSSYPIGVELRRWKNSTTPPWFTFHFGG